MHTLGKRASESSREFESRLLRMERYNPNPTNEEKLRQYFVELAITVGQELKDPEYAPVPLEEIDQEGLLRAQLWMRFNSRQVETNGVRIGIIDPNTIDSRLGKFRRGEAILYETLFYNIETGRYEEAKKEVCVMQPYAPEVMLEHVQERNFILDSCTINVPLTLIIPVGDVIEATGRVIEGELS